MYQFVRFSISLRFASGQGDCRFYWHVCKLILWMRWQSLTSFWAKRKISWSFQDSCRLGKMSSLREPVHVVENDPVPLSCNLFKWVNQWSFTPINNKYGFRAMNAVTPKSSPLPTPRHRKGEIEVIIPPDITDPLNLNTAEDDATYEAMLTSPLKRTQKKKPKNKKRKSHRSSSGPGSGKEDSIEGAKLVFCLYLYLTLTLLHNKPRMLPIFLLPCELL